MKKILPLFLFLIFLNVFSIFLIPQVTNADFLTPPTFEGLVPCGKTFGTPEEMVPCSFCHLPILVQRLVKFSTYLATMLLIASLLITGAMFAVSSLNNKWRDKAKKIIQKSITGFLYVLGAYMLLNLILWTVGRSENSNITIEDWNSFSCGYEAPPPPPVDTPSSSVTCENKTLKSLIVECDAGLNDYISLATVESDKPKEMNLKAIASFDCIDANGQITTKEEDVTGDAEWKAVDETIAQTEKGKVQARGSGDTYVTASYTSENIKKDSSIDVYVNSCPIDRAATSPVDFGDDSIKVNSLKKENFLTKYIKNFKINNIAEAVENTCAGCGNIEPKRNCEFVAGNQNAEFVFIIGRTNIGKHGNACAKPDVWIKDDPNQLEKFNLMTSQMSAGLNLLPPDIRRNFSIYRSKLVYGTTDDKNGAWIEYMTIQDSFTIAETCKYDIPKFRDVRAFMAGFIQNGAEGRAYTGFGISDPAFYCIDANFSSSNLARVFAHEQIGHQFANLDDEYFMASVSDSENNKGKRSSKNCTTNPQCNKWSEFTEGCFQGCLYMRDGVYRSSKNSIMGSGEVIFSLFQQYLIKIRYNTFPDDISDFYEDIEIIPWKP